MFIGDKMGDFKKNPRKPYEVKCLNSIRKRIAMHEKTSTLPKTHWRKISRLQGKPSSNTDQHGVGRLGGMLAVLSTLLCRTKKLLGRKRKYRND